METKKIAIPIENNLLCAHFGHAQHFIIFETEDGKIISENTLKPPPHEPGVLPQWLSDLGVSNLIAGGIGQRAISIFNSFGIEVIFGVPSKSPKELVTEYLDNKIQAGDNFCDH